jgi:hypothetical protein
VILSSSARYIPAVALLTPPIINESADIKADSTKKIKRIIAINAHSFGLFATATITF